MIVCGVFEEVIKLVEVCMVVINCVWEEISVKGV